MEKSPDAFRTISEVADDLDLPQHVLRFWETRFPQIKPMKRGGGRRYYRPEDVELLKGIRHLLYDHGYTIKGVQKILRERGVRHVIGLGTPPEGEAPPPEPAGPVPAPPPAAQAANGPAPRAPQRDLFEPAGGSALAVAARDRPADAAAKPMDKRALKALLAELQALRAVMIEDPR